MTYLDYYNRGFDFSFKETPIYYAGALLVASNYLVYSMMSIVYLFGKASILSNLFIYGPIAGIITTSVRDKYSFPFVLSSTLATSHGVAHGLAHVVYPFLDEDIGVNRSIDVWQDQFLHLGQSVLFSSIFLDNSSLLFTVYSFAFMLGNLLNVVLGYNCWGESCHDLYVWVSLLPALSSRSEEHTSELQSRLHLVCRLLLEKKKSKIKKIKIKKKKKKKKKKKMS